jgi:hypothetical protein
MVARRAARLGALALAGCCWLAAAAPASGEGPAAAGGGDPGTDGMAGLSGTEAGWLRLSDAAMARWERDIRETAARYGVSPRLVQSVIRVESAFNPLAVSRKGARGLMQLMPDTARALGVQDSFDPRQNIDGGVRHLRGLLDRYAGDLVRAVAAYNAGAGAVDQHGGIPPFPETQQYVQKVLQQTGLPEGRGTDAAALREATERGPDEPAPGPAREASAGRLPRLAGGPPGARPVVLPLIDQARRTGRLVYAPFATRADGQIAGSGLDEPISRFMERLREHGAARR